jgi:hypothetical protein
MGIYWARHGAVLCMRLGMGPDWSGLGMEL